MSCLVLSGVLYYDYRLESELTVLQIGKMDGPERNKNVFLEVNFINRFRYVLKHFNTCYATLDIYLHGLY